MVCCLNEFRPVHGVVGRRANVILGAGVTTGGLTTVSGLIIMGGPNPGGCGGGGTGWLYGIGMPGGNLIPAGGIDSGGGGGGGGGMPPAN